ncbi:MAG: glucosaminidase domain-containing protein [Bacteroidales bacterium]|nr:glucosaminidase domain-containing protein [Bacteroidales bacterium]
MRILPLILLLSVLFSSCNALRKGKSTVPVPAGRSLNEYITSFADLAMSEMRRTGVPASITLAQGIIESDYGRSRLAREANNHFGIKCHNNWTGRRIYHDDDRRNECFRRYRDVSESYIDHSDFLRMGSRYNFLFELDAGDYKAWARGLKKAGYATNPRYANMLVDMIERNNLHVYDELVISGRKVEKAGIYDAVSGANKYVQEPEITVSGEALRDETFVVSRESRKKVRNRIEYIIVREDDSFKSLAEEFELLRWEIYRYNELDDDAELQPGRVLYIQPKRKRAEAGNDYHIVKEGETMYTISQLYGIRLQALYDKNRMEPGSEPAPGTELWLRKAKPPGL